MKECSVCTKQLPSEITYCPYCGEPLTPPLSAYYWVRAVQAALFGGLLTLLLVGVIFLFLSRFFALNTPLETAPQESVATIVITNSPTIEEIGYIPRLTEIEAIDSYGDDGYWVDRTNGLHGVDLQDPPRPRLRSTYPSPFGDSRHVWADDGYVALISGSMLELLDTSVLSQPRLLGATPFAPAVEELVEVEQMALAQPYLFLATGSQGLQVLNVLNLDQPYWVTDYRPPVEVWGVTVVGDRLYLALGEDGLSTFDTTDLPDSLVVIGSTEIPAFARHVIPLAEPYLAVAAGSGVAIVDTSDLPKVIAYSDFYGQLGVVFNLTVSEDKLYIAASKGVGLVDIHEPTQLALLDFYETSQPISQILVKDIWLYGITWSGDTILFRVAE